MLHMTRHSPFMHSMNHPKILAVATMAETACPHGWTAGSDLDDPVYIPDGLAGAYWPVYPEIGERLGLSGSYDWTWNQQRMNLPEYVRHAYANYDKLELDPDTVVLAGAARKRLDSVLGAYYMNPYRARLPGARSSGRKAWPGLPPGGLRSRCGPPRRSGREKRWSRWAVASPNIWPETWRHSA